MSTYDELVDRLRSATLRLRDSATNLRIPEDLFQPSALPGWTRAHLLVHLARNANGLRNLLLSARSGEPLGMYASATTREADIQSGIERPPAVILADLHHASMSFLIEAGAMPVERLDASVAFTSGRAGAPFVNARDIVELRLSEVEVHHVDLDFDYGFTSTPTDLADHLLRIFMTKREEQGCRFALILDRDDGNPFSIETGSSPRVFAARGPALAWLTGRSVEGIDTDADLPVLPPFG